MTFKAPNDTFFCEGENVTVIASGANKYAWDGGAPTTTGEKVISTAGKHTVVGISASNCESLPVEFNVVKKERPTVSIDGNDFVCSGKNSTLTAVGNGGAAPYVYKWNTSTIFSENASLQIENNGTYTVFVKDKLGCESKNSASKTVKVTKPTIKIEGESQFCNGENLPLTASGEAEDYYWNGSSESSLKYFAQKTETVSLRGVDANGCESTVTKNVKMRAVPKLTGSNLVYFCDGGDTELKVNKVDTVLAKYKWDSEEITTQNTHLANEERVYKVVGYDSHNCPTEPFEINVKKTLLPEVSIEGGNTICLHGDPIELTAVFDKEDGKQYDIKWSTGKTTESITVLEGEAKRYTVDVTVKEGGCKLEQASHDVSLIKNAEIRIDGDNQFCTDSTIILKGVVDSNNSVKFYWNESATPSETISVSEEGEYKLKAEDDYGCVSNVSKYVYQRAIPVLSGKNVMYYCSGSNTTLEVTMDSMASGYVWDSNPIGIDNTHVADETRTYSVVGYDKKNCPTEPFNIDVKKTLLPEVRIEGKNTICLHGDPIELTAVFDKEDGKQYDVKWSTGKTTESITVLEGEAKRYIVDVTVKEGGCKLEQASHDVSLIENAEIIIDGDNQFCTDSTIILKGVVNSNNPVKFYWNESETPSETISVSEEGEYKLKAEDDYGCVSNVSKYVYQRAIPVLSGENVMYYCSGANTTLEVTMDSMASGYVWDSNPIGIDNTHVADETRTYSVVGYDKKNCPSNRFDIDVRETGIPAVSITGDTTVCKYGESIVLTANLANVNENNEIKWSTGETTQSITILPGTGGTYAVSVTATEGECSSPIASHKVALIENAEISIDGPAQFCTDSTIYLVGKVTSGNDVDFYWNESTTASDSLLVTEGGEYKVMAEDKFGCKTSESRKINKRAVPVLTGLDTTFYCQYSSNDLVVTMDSVAKGYVWNEDPIGNKNTYFVDSEQTVNVVGYDLWNCPTKPKEMVVKETMLPVIKIEGDTTVCLYGDSVKLTVNVIEGKYDDIIWNNGKKGKSINVKDGEYIAYATISVCESFKDTHNVELITNAEVIIKGVDEICTDSTAVLTAESVENLSYVWDGHDTNKDTIVVGKTGVYKVEGTDKYGCKSTAKKTVTQRDVPLLTLPPTAAYCQYDSIKLVATLNREASSYVWDGVNLKLQNYKYANEVRNYSVMAYDNLKCPSNTATVAVTETKIPVVTIKGPTHVCQNADPIVLAATVEGTHDRYEWNTNETTPSISVQYGGQFIAKAYIGVCASAPDTFDVEFKQIPSLRIQEGPSASYCDLWGIKLHAISPTAIKYRWEPEGVDTDENHVYTEGKHIVYVEDEFGCINKDSVVTFVKYGPDIAIHGDTTLCEFSITEIRLDCPECVSQTWSTGETDESILIYEPGDYMVEGIGPNGCPNRAYHHLDVTQAPELEIVGETEILSNDSTTLTAIATGSEPFRYYWTPIHYMGNSIVVHSEDIDQWQTFTAMVYDKNNCYNFQSILVTKHSVKLNGKKEFCEGDSTTLTAVGNGIVGLKWSTGDTASSITLKDAGLYSVISTHDNGMVDTLNFEIVVRPNPVLAITGDLSICRGDSSFLIAEGDAKEYYWNTGVNSDTIVVREANEYSVTAISKYGCLSYDTINVIVYDLPDVSIVGPDTVLEESSIFLNALGAITYHWETPDTISEKIEVFEGGTYRVTGVDEHNCMNSATHDVRTIPIPHPLINDTTNGHAIACVDDKVTLIASGAETYLWDTGETNDTIYVTESRVYTVKGCLSNGQCRENSYSVEFSPHPRMMKVEGETKICSDSFSVFTAYTYNDTLISHFVWSTGEETQSVMVRDSQLYSVSAVSKYGCLSDTLSVTLAYHPTPEPLITGIPEVCTGSATTLYANGGTKYLWLDSGEETESINVAAPGKRTLRVWNEFGCAADTSIFVDDRGVPVVDITGKVEICEGDSAILSADGIQFMENHYLWNTGDTTKSIVVDKSGDYSVVLTNRSGCVTTDTLHFVVHPNPVIGINGVDYVCTKDSIALKCSPISGNKIVKYNWSTGETDSVEYVTKTGVYTLQVIDEFTCYSNVASHEIKSEIPSPEPWITGIPEVCEGSETQLHANGGARYLWMVSGEESDYINVSKPGKQVLRAWSEFGCKADTSIYVEDRGVPVVVVAGKDGVCDGDSVTLSAEGIQFMENHYLWNTGDTTPSIVVNAPGDYSVTLTNRSGCVAVDTLHFEVYSNPVVDIDGVDYVCANDSIDLKYSQISGNKIVKYNWSTGETDSVEYVTKTGVYTLQVIDEHSCYSNVASHEIKSEIPSPEPWISGILEVCEGSFTRLRANGGVRYLWLDSGDETEYLDITKPGKHMVRAWSEYGCKADTSIFVEDRGKALVNIVGKEGVCEGDSTTLSAEGILYMENYYLWNTGDTTSSIVVDKPGDYNVVLTNRSGCVATDTLHFEVYPNPVIEIDGGDYVCVDDSIALKVKQISGNKIAKYSWNTGETNAVEFVANAGTYTLQIVDVHTCYSNIASHEVQMRVPNPVSVTGDFDICVEQEDVATVVAYSEGAAFYSWLQNSDTLVYGNPELSARYKGNYRVVTTDSFGCRSYKNIEIIGHKAPHVRIYGAEIPVCGPDTAKLSSASEQIVVAYEWNTGDTTSYIVTDHSGDFWLLGTDIYGCYAIDSAQLILNDIPGMHLEGELGYCPNESTDINVVGAEYYLWSSGSNNNHAVIHEAGDYTVYGRDKYGCEKTIDFHVVEYYVPDVKLVEYPNVINRKDPTISFLASTTDDISNSSFVWDMGDGGVVEDKEFDYTFDLSKLRMFKVVMSVQTIDGCAYNRTVMLPVDLDIPNTITPNGDGLNDTFMEGFELEIFDRHGKRVFYGNNGWDGYLEDGRVVADTYYYVIIDVTGEIYRGYVTVRK